MKRLTLPLLLLSSSVIAQTKPTAEEIIRRVADNIIQTTTFQFVNNKTNEINI